MKNTLRLLLLLIVIPVSLLADSPQILKTFPGGGNKNYGCWDGHYFWISNFGSDTISRVGQDGTYNTYSLTPTAANSPLQLAYDGRYIWVACADALCSLVKFDPTTNQAVATYTYNRVVPPGPYGGIQGVTWDGTELWIGLNQGLVIDVNPTNGAILKEANNYALGGAGGITVMTTNGIKYVYVSCNLVIVKINTQKMACQTLITPASPGNLFRITNDGTYLYAASYSTQTGSDGVVKIDPNTGALLAGWGNSGTMDLNDICLDKRGWLWVCGDNGTVTAVDSHTGAIMAQFPNAGVSTVVVGGDDDIWTVNWKTANVVTLIGDVVAKPTPTVLPPWILNPKEQPTSILKVEIGPNPSRGDHVGVCFNLSSATNLVQIRVFSLAGTLVTETSFQGQFQAGWNKLALPPLNVASEIYFVMVKSGQSVHVAKMMIIR